MHGNIKTMAAAKKLKALPTARPQTQRANVSSPTVPGAIENVDRVFNVIECMNKRKQIDAHQFRAAERIQNAWLVVYGSPGGVMDFERARGGSLPGSPPPLTHMTAAQTLNETKIKLYPKDYRIVSHVVIEGHTIEDVASIICGGEKPSRAVKEETGRALRNALTVLADYWWPRGAEEQPSNEIRIYAPGARPTIAAAGMIGQAKTVHATGHRVFRNR